MGGQSQLNYQFQNFYPNIAKDLAISEEAAIEKQLVIQPVGIQGKVSNRMRNTQNYVPMFDTSQAVTAMKTAGITGFKIVH